MKTTVAEQAAKEREDIDALPANAVPDDADVSIAAEGLTPDRAEAVKARMAEIDLSDSASIIGFGAKAQAELQEISAKMLEDVKNKDIGPAGDSLRDIVTAIRGFSVSELDIRRDRSWWEKVTGRTAPFAKFVSRYERVQEQLDRVTEDLLRHEHQLLKDIRNLDTLYDRTLAFHDALVIYILAGDQKLAELDQTTIPAREAALNDLPDDAKGAAAQGLRDLRAMRDDLDRRVHDLKLTRQVMMQALPSLRLVQENDKSLVAKINSTLVNTVPLWETQLAQAVTIQRGREAAASIAAATDLTNELLTRNAENLRDANREIRTQIERGVFDVESVRAANVALIAAINESLHISEEAKGRRAAAEDSLAKMETDLRDALSAARGRPQTLTHDWG
ncbi:toxic anion resistance protein [Falsirhodobacter algicola]|uniref:Toxic anion resistance protein n=1 Tax=Falsirhodobacter algicola TaxID=2692330 RepID=A0A8J8SKR8_9RHOB|nr:toxic anion resistance protein [Falsirhodobacter algicola]QUS35653.1 toxic anion resistance protein [Falsirhodobacter algicola]